MGMVLDVYRLVKKAPCPDMDAYPFDTGKYVDDKKFVHEFYFQSKENERQFDHVSCDVYYCCAMSYWRPKDLNEAIVWVGKNLVGNRKLEIIKILQEMKTRKDLYFNYS